MGKLLVYVAGPITKGPLDQNVRKAHEAGIALLKSGFAVIVPHGSCFWGNRTVGVVVLHGGDQLVSPTFFEPEVLPEGTKHGDWYGCDLEIVRRCDAVYRLPGESTGADLEVAEAEKAGIPVFTDMAAIMQWGQK